jgi:hypothetical protein
MEYQRKMSRISAEENKVDVDGIPIANQSNIRIRLHKMNSIKAKSEFRIVKDQIVTTSQYLKFVNAIMYEKYSRLKQKEIIK